MTARRITRGLAAVIAVPTVFVLTTSPALATATADPVTITNTETVQARLDPSGKVDTARIYEQLALTGNGKVKLTNPVSTKGLRNLDSWGGYSVKDGKMAVDTTVDGEQRLRTVSDFDKKKLPIKVAVTYTLNGKQLKKPGDVVGKKGRLEAHYVVENTSARSEPVTITDGYGKQVTEQADVVIPMVGQLTTVLPPEFGNVSSNEANKAGDGKGGTKLSFTVTLFPPVGAATAEFGWSAQVKDAIVPEAELTALPVSPLDSPTFKTAVTGYESGAEKGTDLVDGGTELDANLIKLRDGSQKLLSGLLQLNAGAKTLNEGLADKAAPGATKLSGGAAQLAGGLAELDTGASLLRTKTGEAAAGADKLDKGAGTLQKGATDLNAGAGQLKAGTGKLASGLNQATGKAPALIDGLNKVGGGLQDVEDGLALMYGKIGQLPAKAQELHTGIKQLRAGIGSADQPDTLLNGLHQLKASLAGSGPGIDKMRGGVHCVSDVLDAVSNGRSKARGYDEACYGAAAALLNGPAGEGNRTAEPNPIKKMILDATIPKLGIIGGPVPDPTKPLPADATLQEALAYLKARLTGPAVNGITKLQCGLDNTSLGLGKDGCPATEPGLMQGLVRVDAGVSFLVSKVVEDVQKGIGTKKDTPKNKTLRGGVNGLQGGVGQIQAGGKTLLTGLNQLSDGADQLNTGAGSLATGTGKLKAGVGVLVNGTGQLDDGLFLLSGGTGKLADGVGKARDGSDQLATGSKELATGIGSAAEGSGKLAEGLTTAADGATGIPDGAKRLSAEGALVLQKKGADTALDFGRRYGMLAAAANRAKTEGMPYGAPEGAASATAYSLKLAGATGEGGRSWVRLLAGLALFAVAVGATGLIRRRARH
ncbi:hypothetical protein GCM10029976_034490 [Kribbella albertanoniae]|uniref:Uncharacterized protein n=1 Tax=Kribbella albertanoniae TaxID=1266829 RepID=A0A4R4Q0X9_9ACTN|nr:hypothetical protein [Kribbella albertanoniae]TDC28568.1 hypothetical protein E1261_18080 [Kribbella albertanoniae]